MLEAIYKDSKSLTGNWCLNLKMCRPIKLVLNVLHEKL